MNDKEQFAQLLGLIPPWKIADVHVDYYVPQIHIEISYPNGEKAYFLVIHFRLKPTIAVAHMLTCLKHRITNAVSKGINSKIQQIKRSSQLLVDLGTSTTIELRYSFIATSLTYTHRKASKTYFLFAFLLYVP